MFRIGEFSFLAKVTVKALRYYDKIGLLKPAFIDRDTSYRYYTEEQLNDIRKILEYKEVGISNVDVLKIIKNNDEEQKVYAEHKKVLEAEFKDVKRKLESLDRLIHGETQEYSAQLKKVESVLVYSCCGYVSSEENIHDFIKACNVQFEKTNSDIKFSEPDYCCVVYPGDGYRESNIFIEYAQSVERVGKETHTLKFKTMKEITAVSVIHHGEYHNIRNAYAYAVEWAKKNGYQISGEARERYVKGNWNCNDVSEWQTELQIPVIKKEGK